MTGKATAPVARPFTPRLNAALEIVIAKEEAAVESHDRMMERMWAWITRHAWGNWCSYAISRDAPPLGSPSETEGEIRQLVFGAGPCPFCKRSAKPQVGIPAGWRWHRSCMALAYACEAVQYGTPREQEWGRKVIEEGGTDVPAMMERGGEL